MRVFDNNNSMLVKVNVKDTIETLKANLAKHQAEVAEARAAYFVKTKEALLKYVESLDSGKVIATTLSFPTVPDHSKVYETAIRMLEIHQDETITFDSDQVRSFVMNEWDWSARFYEVSSAYLAR